MQKDQIAQESHNNMRLPISVLVLTKNESFDISECIKSISFSDDIHVLDSFSADGTVEIAEKLGATITQREFDNFSSQRNYGLRHLNFKNDWLLILDADERVPIELENELHSFIKNVPANVAAARIRRRDYWWGRWLKYAQISPFFIRLVRPQRVHYEREINEVLIVDGETNNLKSHFNHFPFSKGLRHWIAKHNLYSDMEALHIYSGVMLKPSWRKAFFGSDFNERRVHQKAVFYGLPARPFIKFIYMLVVRQSFLDGWPGIRYTVLQCVYEYFIVLKTKEMLAKRNNISKFVE